MNNVLKAMGQRDAGKLATARKVAKGIKSEIKKRPAAATTEPFFSCEWSRNQVMCRTGGAGPGWSHAIKFEDAGGVDKAVAAARAWVQKQRRKN